MKTIDKILCEVSTKYGAPMGRPNVNPTTPQGHKTIFDCRVVLDRGGYDKGGAYWGIGKELRVSYTKDLSYINFYRRP
jgi:hypothetical protein